MFSRLAYVAVLLCGVIAATPDAQAGPRKKKNAEDEKSSVIRQDVMKWLLANNPGLAENFLTADPPDKTIKLPDGSTAPIYRLKQFLEVNFRITFFARKEEPGSEVVPVMEEKLRKLLSLPDFRERVLSHKPEYKINRKMVTAEEAYDYLRRANRHLGVTAKREYHAPVGGGGGIGAPSWAVWKAMNIFYHEACHCLNINHDSGGLSGPIAGTLRKWDRQKKWDYQTFDVNALLPQPATAPAATNPYVGKTNP